MSLTLKKTPFAAVVFSLLISCNTGSTISSVNTAVIELNSTTVPKEDPEASSTIDPYKSKLDSDMNSVLAICEENLTKANPEGRLGNLIADLTLEKANEYCVAKGIPKADISLLNNGGLRTSLPEGEILKRRVFELMPFENEIVIVTLTGNKTLMLFDYLAYVNGMPLAGARMGIKDGQQAEISIGGEPIDTNRTYRVATSDYLAHGGDRMKFFLTPLKIENLGHKLRDAIIEYMVAEHKAGRTINAQLDGRIKTME